MRVSLSTYAQFEDVFPAVGVGVRRRALRPYAARIDLINFRHERTPSTKAFLRPETDLVCYSINWRQDLELIRDDINSLPPQVLTILGGRTATENPRRWLEVCPNVDAVVCGDGEQAIAEIAAGRVWSEIAGLAHRGDDGQLVHNPPRANVPLDEDLMPARELRRRRYYLTSKGVSTGITMDMVAGSRGCPFNCKFLINHIDLIRTSGNKFSEFIFYVGPDNDDRKVHRKFISQSSPPGQKFIGYGMDLSIPHFPQHPYSFILTVISFLHLKILSS